MDKKKYVALKPFNNRIYYKNGIFDKDIGIQALTYSRLKKYLEKSNIYLNTLDIRSDKELIRQVYFDIPYPFEIIRWFKLLTNIKKPTLFTFEPPIVNPFNYMKILHSFFDKIYTWNDNLVDNKKYFKFFFPNMRSNLSQKEFPFKSKKLLVLINTNWLPIKLFEFLSNAEELYTERIKAIDFFEKHCLNDFDLYGKGWNQPERFSLRQRLFGFKKYRVYRGQVIYKEKIAILSRYKFCIAFENSSVPGFISEKLFDCFKARCVPIYLGAQNVKKYIPDECYINFNNFKNYDHLLHFLQSMDNVNYQRYLDCAKSLMGDKRFTNRWFEKGFQEIFLKAIHS